MRRWGAILYSLCGSLCLGPALADDYPTKPVTLVIPYEVGGTADTEGREAAKPLAKALGQSVEILNKYGSGGLTGFEYVGNQKPDGYTVGWLSASILSTALYGVSPYKYNELYEYVSGITYDGTAIAVRADSPWKSIDDLVDAAKSDSGGIIVGTAGEGSYSHLVAAAMLQKKGATAAYERLGRQRLSGLLDKTVDVISISASQILDAAKKGEVRVLAVQAPQDIEALKGFPTFQDLGLALDVHEFRGFFVPRGTPEEVKVALDKAVAAVASDSGFIAQAAADGYGVQYIGYDDFPAFIDQQAAALENIINVLNQ